jgi:nucleotide-binding universal stress UspA family protein
MVTRILCAIDDTEHSETAAEFAISLASQLSARLVFHMVNPAILPSKYGAPVYMWTDDYIRSYLDEALRRARNAGLNHATGETQRATSVADSIVAFADDYEADLIVIGASGRGRIADFLRRSTSRAVADTAHCPVLIVKHNGDRWPRPSSLPHREPAKGNDVLH